MFTVSWQQHVIVYVVAQQQDFRRVIHPPVFLLTDVDHVPHVGETFALQVSPFERLQLGQHRVGHFYEVAVPFPVDDTEGVHVRVLAQVFQFRLFVVRVHRNGYCPYLGTGIQESQPVGHILGPDTYMRTVFYTDGQQSLGHVVYAAVELLPREAQVPVRVDDVFLVRRLGCPVFQPVAQSSFR